MRPIELVDEPFDLQVDVVVEEPFTSEVVLAQDFEGPKEGLGLQVRHVHWKNGHYALEEFSIGPLEVCEWFAFFIQIVTVEDVQEVGHVS